MLIHQQNFQSGLSDDDLREVVVSACQSGNFAGKRVLIIIPDGTRSMPMPLMFRLFKEYLLPVTARMDYLVALGTHPKMNDTQLSRLLGTEVNQGQADGSSVFNHMWEEEDTFVEIGILPADLISEKTENLLSGDVPIRINKLIYQYDHLIICGPVFPHEVVGFSGGNKYFFPGIAGPEIINFTHWLGALITNYKIIGTMATPVRDIINFAASLIDREVSCFSLVVTHDGTSGIFYGDPIASWAAAATLSSQKHIIFVDKPYKRVLSVMPALYDDLWTAAKGMYKLEPVIADAGEVIIYAPHIHEVSYTHGKILDLIGYHCRDYFIKQWEKYRQYPAGVLAHSTHLRGMGTFDPDGLCENLRIHVTLATGISPERCHQIGLGYLDPGSIKISEWENKQEAGILYVPHAGEMLYRLRVPDLDKTIPKEE